MAKLVWKTQEQIDTENNRPIPKTDMEILGMQLVEKDMQIFSLQNDKDMLGEQLVQIDVRLMMGGM